MKMPKFNNFNPIIAALVLALITNCGMFKKDDDDDDSSTTEITSSGPESTNTLALALPSGLAISAFPKSTSSSLALVKDDTLKTASEKQAERNKIASGAADQCFSFSGDPTPLPETCYEFDSEMSPATNPNGKIYGTKTGKNSDGEACLVTFARIQMQTIIARVDRALAMFNGMICQAKKDGTVTELPKANDPKDLSASMKAALSKGNSTNSVSSAKISRLDDIASRPVFRSDVSSTEGQNTFEFHLVHSPQSESSNDTYNGTLWVKISGGMFGTKNFAMSITYAKVLKDGVYRYRAELREAQVKNTLDPFTDAGLLDMNVSADFTTYGKGVDGYGDYGASQPNDIIANMTLVSFDLNPTNNDGNLAYWRNPGGRYYELARGMIFNATYDATAKVVSGCAITGAAHYSQNPGTGISIRRSIKEGSDATLEPRGFWHPFSNTNTHTDKDTRQETIANGQNFGQAVQKQCFKQDSTGAWGIDTSGYNNDATAISRGYMVINLGSGEKTNVAKPEITEVKAFDTKVKN